MPPPKKVRAASAATKKSASAVPATPKTRAPRGRSEGGEATRSRIVAVALERIRRDGFDRATMRDVAKDAGLSLGAAYHYFPSKEAIVLSFYREHLEQQAAVARAALERETTLLPRLEAVMNASLDVRGADRPMFAALTRTVLDTSNPISLFADETTDLRDLSIGIWRECVRIDEVADDLREPLALALWALQLGLLLRFVLDETPGQRATRKLTDGAVTMVPAVVAMLSLPMLEPVRQQLLTVLREGGLLAMASPRP